MSRPPTQFVDLQVNGYAGVDFNAHNLTPEQLHRACSRLRADGVRWALATIITADLEIMVRNARRLVTYRQVDPLVADTLAGIHFEGPFISCVAGYVGAHPSAAVREASLDAAMQLSAACEGILRLVTLAPECDPKGVVTRWFVEQGVRVAAGHCDPSLDDLRRSLDAGLSMFTHLGNGCPLLLHRHENVIQRVLSLTGQMWITLIADGVHVPWPAFQNYLSLVGLDRAIVVTDATAASGMGPGSYRLGGETVIVDECLATWCSDRSHLVGSASTMQLMATNLSRELGLGPEAIHKLTQLNPAQSISIKCSE